MSKLIRIMIVLALSVTLPAPAFAASTSAIAKGFGSVAWGEDVNGREGFMKLRSVDGIDYYVNLRDRFELKGFGKPTVYYGQAGPRLYAVHLRMKDGTGYGRLSSELTKIYGKGKKSGSGETAVTRWKAGPVRVKLKGDPDGGMKLSFYYQPVAITLDAVQRDADPSSEELARMLPAKEAQVKAPAGALPPKDPEYVGIDVLKYLKEGSELLKLDIPRYQKSQ
ncbi:MAG: hypothetical protein ACOZEN_14950 [Thermodesulfobacteriota bacterium]